MFGYEGLNVAGKSTEVPFHHWNFVVVKFQHITSRQRRQSGQLVQGFDSRLQLEGGQGLFTRTKELFAYALSFTHRA